MTRPFDGQLAETEVHGASGGDWELVLRGSWSLEDCQEAKGDFDDSNT